MYHTYLNERQSLFLKFGAHIHKAILNLDNMIITQETMQYQLTNQQFYCMVTEQQLKVYSWSAGQEIPCCWEIKGLLLSLQSTAKES
jgi:hypothetical protein